MENNTPITLTDLIKDIDGEYGGDGTIINASAFEINNTKTMSVADFLMES